MASVDQHIVMDSPKGHVIIDMHEIKSLDSNDTGDGPRLLEPPEIIRNMSAQERVDLEKSLLKKIDLRLLPMIMVMYILNYIDRANIAAARFAGIEQDLNLDEGGTQFETAVSVLYVGYILMQIPSNLMLNKIGKPGKYLPICMAIWGTISAATAGSHSFGSLLVGRFFLGFVEAAYFPGCLYYLSCWYTRKELSLRTAYFFVGALLAGAFSGLISAGITNGMDGARGLRAWRWLFLIEGVVTIAVAAAAFFVLPDFPRTTTWLDDREVAMAGWRLQEDIGQDDWDSGEKQKFWHGLTLAIRDEKVWILLVLIFGNMSAGSVANFFPTVVSTLRYGRVETLLLTVPPYVLAVIVSLVNAWHADRTGERCLHITLPLSVAIASYLVAAVATHPAARYASMMLMLPGLYSGLTTALAWVSNTLPRPPAKRAAALALINAAGSSSSIYTPFLYPQSAAPRFVKAFVHNSAMASMAIIAAVTLRIMLVRLNKKLERGETVKGAVNAIPGAAAGSGFRFLV
ncbi:hypothetical protein HIM_07368 [Hirsutella minnesotensis 3608]|uniref:Major facilitator superfamily (MFS) profile domain-containing protein n=1 Tax=Hirsutella minnesotensis 3608 TaxID=1043627 RepID=A0A0F7ZHV5_9HYPO|nr:hypothetical protein HIM_07368 [Hirsutella minnesotensis 3608]